MLVGIVPVGIAPVGIGTCTQCTATHIILDNLPSLCQKLSDLVKVWRSYNESNFACFFETQCIWSPCLAKGKLI